MGSAALAEDIVRQTFIEWVTKQENSVRFDNYRRFGDYYDGHFDEVLPPRLRKAVETPFRCFLNYSKPVVDIVVTYVCGKPINIDVTESGMKNEITEIGEALLGYVYSKNGLFGTQMNKLVRIMSKKGEVFLKFHMIPDQQGNPVDIAIDVIRPDVVYPRYADDNYKHMLACAIKWYELTSEGRVSWFAQVFYRDTVETYHLGQVLAEDMDIYQADEEGNIISKQPSNRPHKDPSQWELIEEVENPFGFIPVYHIRNGTDDVAYGVSDLHVMTDLQDALNKAMTDMCFVMDTQAFQRIFIFGSHGTKNFDFGPGVVTEIPNEAGRVQTIGPVSIADYLYAVDTIVDQISAVTYTPRQVFGGYHDVPTSGYALNIRFLQLENKVNEKKQLIRSTLQELNRLILYQAVEIGLAAEFGIQTAEESDRFKALQTDIHFVSGLPKDELMEAQKFMYWRQLGIISILSMMEKAGIEHPEQELQQIMKEYAMMGAGEEEEEGEAEEE